MLLLLRRALFLTGMFWIVRGLVGVVLCPITPLDGRRSHHVLMRLPPHCSACSALGMPSCSIGSCLIALGTSPFRRSHICEHGAVESEEEEYGISAPRSRTS